MEYGAGGEKEKWKSGKQTKGRRIKISWVSEKLLKIFRPLRISGYNFSWACFFFLVVLSISHHIYFLVTSEWEKFLALWESSFFFQPKRGLITQGKVLKTPVNLRNPTDSLNIFNVLSNVFNVLSFPLSWCFYCSFNIKKKRYFVAFVSGQQLNNGVQKWYQKFGGCLLMGTLDSWQSGLFSLT